MALLHSQKGDFKKAEEWFDYARKLEPKNARVRLAHGAWLVDQGRTADARAEVDEALKLDPSSNEAKKIRALVAWHLRDLAAAEAILEPLHRDAPADSFVANLLALALIEQDDAAKQSRGLQLADVNALQFPRSAEVVATLGWALTAPAGSTRPSKSSAPRSPAAAPHRISPTSSPESWPTKARPTMHASFSNPATSHAGRVRSPRRRQRVTQEVGEITPTPTPASPPRRDSKHARSTYPARGFS